MYSALFVLVYLGHPGKEGEVASPRCLCQESAKRNGRQQKGELIHDMIKLNNR